MISIVEPKEHIDVLWSKQAINDGLTFRMMKYVLQVECENKTLLHNVVTGQLVILNEEEEEGLNSLPVEYASWMESLIKAHYLVPEGFDEHQKVYNMRKILRMLNDTQKPKAINHYTILPTTACNARCYYCFEQGERLVTMTEQTAENVVEFISTHRGEDDIVFISWFGGEPTVAASRIDQICKGLRERGVVFKSEMTTNGYLLDEKMVARATNLWNLKTVMICLDGTEKRYNLTKAYVNVKDNPYQRVLRNISYLLENKIHVDLRMNFDLDNYNEFQDIVEEALTIFGTNPYLHVTAHPIVGEYVGIDGSIRHANEEWFTKKVLELNEFSRKKGLFNGQDNVSCLRFGGCEATSDGSVTITPEGCLVRCPEQFGKDQITGNVYDGITQKEIVKSWKEFADYQKCIDCVLYPRCEKIKNCKVKDVCTFSLELQYREKDAAKRMLLSWIRLRESIRRKERDGTSETDSGIC